MSKYFETMREIQYEHANETLLSVLPFLLTDKGHALPTDDASYRKYIAGLKCETLTPILEEADAVLVGTHPHRYTSMVRLIASGAFNPEQDLDRARKAEKYVSIVTNQGTEDENKVVIEKESVDEMKKIMQWMNEVDDNFLNER